MFGFIRKTQCDQLILAQKAYYEDLIQQSGEQIMSLKKRLESKPKKGVNWEYKYHQLKDSYNTLQEKYKGLKEADDIPVKVKKKIAFEYITKLKEKGVLTIKDNDERSKEGIKD